MAKGVPRVITLAEGLRTLDNSELGALDSAVETSSGSSAAWHV